MDPRERIDELVKQLNEASLAYYNTGNEIMTNYEWDALFDELIRLEKETNYIRTDSPSQKTGYEEETGEKEEHEFPALSLAKTKSIEELKKWAMDKEIYLSYKLDGLTLVLTYDDGKLSKILTRGNGRIGTNITQMAKSIYDIPLKINYKGHLVVRGEATISYPDFEKLNATIEDEDEKYANPRNLASGTLSLDDPQKVKDRNVHFNAFTLVYMDDEISSWGKQMEFLKELGFVTVEYRKTNRETLQDAVDWFTHRVETMEMTIPVDGLVICYDDIEYAKTGSVTGHHATRAGLAFKWPDEVKQSTLRYVEWSCAISTISPVAVFEPVELEGTTVSRASLCNITEMKRLGIGGPGSRIQCIKSNKIIPKIVGVTEKIGELEIPKYCPACQAETIVTVSEGSNTETLHCTNADCPAKNVQKFSRFVSKTGMDIEGLSIQTIIAFINEGYVKGLGDIYRLEKHFEEIKQMDGFGEKSCENLGAAIEKSRREVDPVNFIYALCIPLIGTDAAKKILKVTGWEGFLQRLEDGTGFENIDGIGPERSGSIVKWYENSKNQDELKDLLGQLTIQEVKTANAEDITMEGMNFVITGDVFQFKNRNEFKAYVEAHGGAVTGSVSKKTNYLVNNDLESTSSKNTKAKELGIPIISEEEFIEKFGGV